MYSFAWSAEEGNAIRNNLLLLGVRFHIVRALESAQEGVRLQKHTGKKICVCFLVKEFDLPRVCNHLGVFLRNNQKPLTCYERRQLPGDHEGSAEGSDHHQPPLGEGGGRGYFEIIHDCINKRYNNNILG